MVDSPHLASPAPSMQTSAEDAKYKASSQLTMCGLCFLTGPCTDVKPPSSGFTCAEQAGFGKCDADFMQGFCDFSCGRCGTTGAVDVLPIIPYLKPVQLSYSCTKVTEGCFDLASGK